MAAWVVMEEATAVSAAGASAASVVDMAAAIREWAVVTLAWADTGPVADTGAVADTGLADMAADIPAPTALAELAWRVRVRSARRHRRSMLKPTRALG